MFKLLILYLLNLDLVWIKASFFKILLCYVVWIFRFPVEHPIYHLHGFLFFN